MFQSLKYLIINADDFGASKAVNKGIIAGHKKGIITSTSMFANSLCFDSSIKILKANPTLKVGIHLVLSKEGNSGKAVKKNLKKIVDKNSNFKFNNLHKTGLHLIDKKEVWKEWDSQIKKLIKSGIKLDHINGHSHIHIFPYVLDIVIKLAKKYEIKKIRLPYEKSSIKINRQTWKYYLLNYYSKKAKKKLDKAGLDYPGNFYGTFMSGKPTKAYFINLLNSLPNGFNEIIVHPGYLDHKEKNWLAKNRLNELKILTDKEVKTVLKKNKICLTNYGKIK